MKNSTGSLSSDYNLVFSSLIEEEWYNKIAMEDKFFNDITPKSRDILQEALYHHPKSTSIWNYPPLEVSESWWRASKTPVKSFTPNGGQREVKVESKGTPKQSNSSSLVKTSIFVKPSKEQDDNIIVPTNTPPNLS